MNTFLNKMERKFGRYAINNLSLYIIICYVIGYILQLTGTMEFLRLNPYEIIHGQVWRIVTWVLVPPSSLGIFTIIMLFFYYSLGNTLERTWGAFRYNIYIFSGFIFTIIGAFLLYAFFVILSPNDPQLVGINIARVVSTYYVNMSIFLMFACLYPNMQVMLYFIIPVKIKWMAYLYAALSVVDVFVSTNLAGIILKGTMLIMSLLNFIIFFLGTRNYVSPSELRRRQAFKKAVNEAYARNEEANKRKAAFSNAFGSGDKTVSKHKCAICGQTEHDNPDLEFRFCSKCNGNYEYCNEHLFTHKHVE